jgi:hypothetical protein
MKIKNKLSLAIALQYIFKPWRGEHWAIWNMLCMMVDVKIKDNWLTSPAWSSSRKWLGFPEGHSNEIGGTRMVHVWDLGSSQRRVRATDVSAKIPAHPCSVLRIDGTLNASFATNRECRHVNSSVLHKRTVFNMIRGFADRPPQCWCER